MKTAEEVTTGLTADDITAIRTASRIVVRFKDQTAQIECTRQIRPKTVKGYESELTELKREIPIRSRWMGKAVFMSHFNSGAWQALSLILRPGDELYGRCSENGNGYLDKAVIPAEAWTGDSARYHGYYGSLHHDCCWLSIGRKDKTVIHDLLMIDSICPNNSARAITTLIQKGA